MSFRWVSFMREKNRRIDSGQRARASGLARFRGREVQGVSVAGIGVLDDYNDKSA